MLFNDVESIDAKNTCEFLNLVSKHLSSRVEFRQLEYYIVIKDTDGHSNLDVELVPAANLYRDSHSRKPSDRDPVELHIAKYHMTDSILGSSTHSGDITFRSMIPGTYMYQLSVTKKKRRWVKIS